VLSTVCSTGAGGLFLKSTEKFSGLKSHLSNCSVLVLKSQSFRVFFNVRKTKRIARCDGSEPRCCEDIKGIVTPKMGPKNLGLFRNRPQDFFNRHVEMKKKNKLV